jgi:hypothetical protein
MKWGVIALDTRDVDCGYKPRIAARRPDGGKTAMPDYYKAPSGWDKYQDKRLRMFKKTEKFWHHKGRKL